MDFLFFSESLRRFLFQCTSTKRKTTKISLDLNILAKPICIKATFRINYKFRKTKIK